jgi:hypothetical protein
MAGWWFGRMEARRQAETDADALMHRFGEAAYEEARARARQARERVILDLNRPEGHWDRVRRIIGERSGRGQLDTGTRYLTDAR